MDTGTQAALSVVLEYFKTLLSFLGPILVVVVTARMERSRKLEDAQKKLEQEKTDTQNKELQSTLSSIQNSINGIHQTNEEMARKITALDNFEKETRASLISLSDYCRINAEGTRALAKLVSIIGEGLRDQHLDGNITSAISEYRRFEQKTLNAMLTTPPKVDND